MHAALPVCVVSGVCVYMCACMCVSVYTWLEGYGADVALFCVCMLPCLCVLCVVCVYVCMCVSVYTWAGGLCCGCSILLRMRSALPECVVSRVDQEPYKFTYIRCTYGILAGKSPHIRSCTV